MMAASTFEEPAFDAEEILSADLEFTLSRGVWGLGRSPVLMLAAISEFPRPAAVSRLERHFFLRESLASEWAARPLALTERRGCLALVLEDPGGSFFSA
jgi:hypothetical protein